MIRPGDANETVDAWRVAISRRDGPTVLALTRQNVPTFDRSNVSDGLEKGAYVLRDFGDKPDLILIASGSEVGLIMEAGQKLADEGKSVRVVSFPSWELFEKQDQTYRDSVFPQSIQKRLAVEAGVGLGWERYAKSVISIERYGASSPYKTIFEHLGFTAENVVAKAKEL